MKRRLPFAVLFAISLAIVALLPLYVEQTMTRVMYVGDAATPLSGAGSFARCGPSFPITATFATIRIPNSGSR